jgi:ABC-type branched-subunit amino acid transport system ATPase component/branched-subunit amino acid ABC-type transport system permease component
MLLDQYVLFAVIGLGFGTVYAALATGIVVTYRGTGVINFAAGTLGTWGAYVADELVRRGDLILPVVIVPHRIHLSDTVPTLVAVLLGTVSTIVLGLVTYLVVFRPLRTAPTLAKVVASVGVMLTIQGLVVLRFTTVPRVVRGMLPNGTIEWNGVRFPQDRIWLTGIVVIAALLMAAWFRFSRLGLALRAASENERAIAAAHFSPDLLAALGWALASGFIGLLSILASPLTILNPTFYTFAIVPALAAAMVARLSSIMVATAVGLALGSLQSIVVFTSNKMWWPDWARTGLNDAVPFVVLVVALALIGQSLPERGAVTPDPLPIVERPQLRPMTVLGVTLAALVALLLTSGSYRFGVITSMILVLMSLSIVVLTGAVGQISLAQAAFAGAAGFTLSALTTDLHVPFPVAPLLAACAAVVLGLIVGIPAMRIRGTQLAVVTLGLAVAIERFVFRNNSLTDVGGNPIGTPSLFGLDLRVRAGREIARWQFGVMVLVVVTLTTLLVGNLLRRQTGLRFLSVRSDERTAAGIGVNVAGTKLFAFALSSFLAGLAGSLIGYTRGQLSADSFTAFVGLSFLAFAYLGGIGSISGAILAATFVPLGIGFVVIDRNFPFIAERYLLISGVGLILTAVLNPVGIAGATRLNNKRIAAWWRRRQGLARVETLTGQAKPSMDPVVPRQPAAERTLGDVVLDVRGLSVFYGGLRAVDGVDVHVRGGEIVGLIGPNGAGKTTLLDAISGFVTSEGSVLVAGRNVDDAAPHARARAGLGRSWQSSDLFRDLTVRENLQIASNPKAGLSTLLEPFGLGAVLGGNDVIDETLARFGLEEAAHRRPSELSLGRQKLVSIARATVAAPSVLLLDEPMAGLDDRMSKRLVAHIGNIAAAGTGVLVIDHDTDFIFDVCDRVLVLDFGRVIAQGPRHNVRSDPAVIAAYLGESSLSHRWGNPR